MNDFKFKVGDLIIMRDQDLSRRITYIKDNRYGLEFTAGQPCTWYKEYNTKEFIEANFKLDLKSMWEYELKDILNET